MTRTLRTAAIASIVFVLAPRFPALEPVRAEPAARVQTFEEAHAAARTALVGRLLALAQWCHDSELFEERDHAWRAVLGIDVDNPEARKGLRYARNVDGSWKEPAPRPAKNRNPAALEKLPAKRAEAISPFRDEMLGQVEKEKVPPETRKAVFAEILAVDPDDEPVHKLMGEARLGDQWVLLESATGKARRAALKAAIDAAKTAPSRVTPATPTDEEKALSEAWKCGSGLDNIRVLSTGDASQCDKLSNACGYTAAAFETALGTVPKFADGFCIYVVAGAPEKEAFIKKIPGLDDAQRGVLKRTIGGGIPGTWKIVLFEPDPARMLDCGVRHTLAHLLFNSFKITTSHAWVFEGLGLYLTREICGTRLTWFCSGKGVAGEGKNSPRGKLMVASSNWMNEALQSLTKDPAPDLAKVLETDLPAMGVDDMLISYALAAYLVEGRPEAVSAVLQGVGAGTKSPEVLQTALGLSMPELQARLIQWLKERK
jgi:hypothetical protein